jgi:hypothetical protein
MSGKNGATHVLILNVGWHAQIAVPNDATLRKLLDALSRCVIVQERHTDGTYWLPDHEEWAAKISYEKVGAGKVHLNQHMPDEPEREHREAIEVTASSTKALAPSGQRCLLEDLR